MNTIGGALILGNSVDKARLERVNSIGVCSARGAAAPPGLSREVCAPGSASQRRRHPAAEHGGGKEKCDAAAKVRGCAVFLQPQLPAFRRGKICAALRSHRLRGGRHRENAKSRRIPPEVPHVVLRARPARPARAPCDPGCAGRGAREARRAAQPESGARRTESRADHQDFVRCYGAVGPGDPPPVSQHPQEHAAHLRAVRLGRGQVPPHPHAHAGRGASGLRDHVSRPGVRAEEHPDAHARGAGRPAPLLHAPVEPGREPRHARAALPDQSAGRQELLRPPRRRPRPPLPRHLAGAAGPADVSHLHRPAGQLREARGHRRGRERARDAGGGGVPQRLHGHARHEVRPRRPGSEGPPARGHRRSAALPAGPLVRHVQAVERGHRGLLGLRACVRRGAQERKGHGLPQLAPVLDGRAAQRAGLQR
eukprot:scaffold101_cov230-Pinguiococcus_pyrenoidosus.AAC.5